ncbi:spore germination protein [Thermoactinomyces intermedius]|jgi:spore germination protein KA|uniref:Spore germination protein n=2 Tax=Thermoactinomyces TaxID=2023 RepID=A0A8I1A7K9_THEIN|nr:MULTISPECIES: spore germination protein [Thermoactinomyces]MBA4547510.1 spore germination protein [Thermoactinomyces intermedius]MBA4551627.1 spore germination protein [Thermoactinomyces vulgaris]MBA4596494.1 spore germination protein [Thermoactinomyces vulgaris]MBA4836064.1 spore germination protein [Thermoactinomyces intermedius]MBH8588797.1 spore germination protein [Thermoactinomyces vulgaris]
MRRPNRVLNRERKKKKKLEEHNEQQLNKAVKEETPVYPDLDQNLEFIKNVLGDSSDLVIREFTIDQPRKKAAVIYFDELINKELAHNFLIRPLIKLEKTGEELSDPWETIVNEVEAGETEEVDQMRKVLEGVLGGDTVLLVDGSEKGLIVGSKGWATRGVDEPRAEQVVRGPREGLSETLNFSLSMIRHRLRDPSLRVKYIAVGKRTKTTVAVLYIEEISEKQIVQEVEERIKRIKIDGILEAGYIEEMIQDQMWTPFPLLQNTERPDTVVSHLLEGKVAVMVDGAPQALIAPAVFSQFYNSPEDYYERYLISTFLRFIRLLSLFIALLLPALYIAFISFHPEMIPSDLMLAMAAGRATVPFSAIVEALIMEISVEILREASIRLPGPIGPTIGIVGALVIGNAAVTAGLVSPAFVIVVGLTTISSYANPNYNAAISVRLLRFPFMIVAAMFGLFGIMIGLMLLLLHLVQLRSFGVPYMAPFAPLNLRDLRDSLIRIPWPWMKKRPTIYQTHNKIRLKKGGTKDGS